jgi:hypothetical protein
MSHFRFHCKKITNRHFLSWKQHKVGFCCCFYLGEEANEMGQQFFCIQTKNYYKERPSPQKAANVSVIFKSSKKSFFTSLKCIENDCIVFVNFQRSYWSLQLSWTIVNGQV